MSSSSRAARDAIWAYLEVLARDASRGELLELRYRLPRGRMAKRFFPAESPAGLVEAVARLGLRADAYVGCALRQSAVVGHAFAARVVWADCDTVEAVERLAVFEPEPTMVVRSGARGGRHAYWAVDEPMRADAVEAANARLALALGADSACCDAGRILRPPGTRNFKYDPPADVRLELLERARTYPLVEITSDLPVVPERPTPRHPTTRRLNDPLLAVPPAEYVSALLGVRVPRHGKVCCPFHEDEDPSLHVYREPGRGWFCFSCRRGGSVYDLAADLWGEETRGPGVRALRRRLSATLDVSLTPERPMPER